MVIEQCDLGDNSSLIYEYCMCVNQRFIQNDVLTRIKAMPNWASDVEYITVFANAWQDFTLFVKLLERVFGYMNRYCTETLGKEHTTDVSFFAFKEQVFWPQKN